MGLGRCIVFSYLFIFVLFSVCFVVIIIMNEYEDGVILEMCSMFEL